MCPQEGTQQSSEADAMGLVCSFRGVGNWQCEVYDIRSRRSRARYVLLLVEEMCSVAVVANPGRHRRLGSTLVIIATLFSS